MIQEHTSGASREGTAAGPGRDDRAAARGERDRTVIVGGCRRSRLRSFRSPISARGRQSAVSVLEFLAVRRPMAGRLPTVNEPDGGLGLRKAWARRRTASLGCGHEWTVGRWPLCR